jgi:hypothetical protein
LQGLIAPLVDADQSRRAIAVALNNAGHRTEQVSLWRHTTVGRVIEKAKPLSSFSATSTPLLASDMLILLLNISGNHEIQP